MELPLNPRELSLYKALSRNDPAATRAVQAMVFEKPMPSIREFVLSPDYLDHSSIIFESVIELMEAIFQPDIREAHAEVGRGGGKSVLAAVFQAYNLHWLNNLRRPQEFYGRRPRSIISVINVSISAEQAQAVIFEELLSLIEGAKCFKGMFVPRKRDLFFPRKRIRAIAGHSGSTSWRGYQIFAGIADEINFMKDKRHKSNADEMWAVLQGSCSTRFPGSYKLLSISSSRERGDFEDRNINWVKENGVEVKLRHIENLKLKLSVARDASPAQAATIEQPKHFPGMMNTSTKS